MDFSDLYEKYFDRIHKYACWRAPAPQEADDITALIFEKLFKKYGGFDGSKANIEVWIFTLARNVVNDYYRWHKIRNFFSISDYEESLALPDTTSVAAEREEEQKNLRQALTKLDRRERDLLGLKYSQGFNNRQIAAITGLTESNTGIILMRAVNKLRIILNQED
jgi:RNA polymerase sigma-70 factor (ECF subfamily)